MIRIIGILGALAVVMGAFGAHMLKDMITPERLSAYRTGVEYHFFHVLALLGIYVLKQKFSSKIISRSFYLILTGIILFSGSLYLLALQDVLGMNLSWLGPITPIGGLFFIAGWLNLAFSQHN
jgi:uncharacterized membrane protein YgdD (TMEM256/DUF423 family)